MRRAIRRAGIAVAATAALCIVIAGCAPTSSASSASSAPTSSPASSSESSTDAGLSEDEIRDFYADYIAALNSHDYSHMEEFISDDIAFGSQTLTRDGIVEILTGIVDAVPDFHWQVDQIIVEGDRLAVKLTNSGTPTKEWIGLQPTGASFSSPELAMYRIQDGRFVEMFNIFDTASVASQLAAG